ncbi:MAG: Maf-like protein [Micrococcales bacterium]|nr:Maf-like protein [Micrococcales bacterium]MCL2668255.1 Maf-like protein [Micrococcales bacterium]
MTLLLASASPARLHTLRSAGFDPSVQVSHIDEDQVLADAGPLDPAQAVLVLARAKAEAVAREVTGVVVLGCDSMLELNGKAHGKPGDAAQAAARWRTMRGRHGVLHTGHWLVDTRDAAPTGLGATASAVVHFADVSDEEIDAYVATGEPLHVAGAFTIDGLGGPFVERVDGDPHTVVGVSLPLLRHLLADLGVTITGLWSR